MPDFAVVFEFYFRLRGIDGDGDLQVAFFLGVVVFVGVGDDVAEND